MSRDNNILKSRIGDKIRFVNPQAGLPDDINLAKKSGLVVDQVYILSKIVIHNWCTDLYLEGLDGAFNSVQFDVVVESEVNCICCDKVLETEPTDDPITIHPIYNGLIFRASGNYGSTIFDPMPTRKEERF